MSEGLDYMEVAKTAMLEFLAKLDNGASLSNEDLALVNETKNRVDTVKEDLSDIIQLANEVHRICTMIQIKSIQNRRSE